MCGEWGSYHKIFVRTSSATKKLVRTSPTTKFLYGQGESSKNIWCEAMKRRKMSRNCLRRRESATERPEPFDITRIAVAVGKAMKLTGEGTDFDAYRIAEKSRPRAL